jgi:hypothetical protein
MAELDGIAALASSGDNLLAFVSGGHLVDLRARYSVLGFVVDLRANTIEISLYGEGAVSHLQFEDVTELYSPESGIDFGDRGSYNVEELIRPDTFRATPESTPPSEPQWFTFETDAGFSVAIKAVRARFGRAAWQRRHIALAANFLPLAGREPGPGWWQSAVSASVGAEALDHARLDQAEFDFLNRVVRVVVSTRTGVGAVEFQDVLRWRLLTMGGENMRAVIGSGEHWADISDVEVLERRSVDGQVVRSVSVSTVGNLGVTVDAGVTTTATLTDAAEM